MHKHLTKATVWLSQTCAVSRSIVSVSSRTVAACSASRRVGAFALAVTPSVLGQALVYV